MAYPNGQQVNLSYFGNSGSANDQRLETIQNVLVPGTTTLSAFTYTYAATGRISQWAQLTNGTTATWNTLTYSAADELDGVTVSASGAVTDSYSYTYDNAGNRLTSVHNSTSASFTMSNSVNKVNQIYPAIGAAPVRVRGVTNLSASVTINNTAATVGPQNMFSLDLSLAAGTRTISISATSAGVTKTSSYSEVVPSTTSSSVFAYDANGNLLYDGTNSYDWDGADRLIRIRQSGSSTEFVYDGLGRRVAEWDNGSLAKQWVWCGDEVCEERNSGNSVTKRFFSQGEQISGSSYFYSRDHLGSIREMTDSSHVIRARYSYDPYGVRSANSVTTSAVEADFGFTGDYFHAATGLSLTRYRAYNAGLARWLNRDPIGEKGGDNLYGYVGNNPINELDPLGLNPTDSFLMQFSEAWYGYLSSFSIGVLPTDPDDSTMQDGANIADKVQLALMLVGDEAGAANEARVLKASAKKLAVKSCKKLSAGEIKALERAGVDIHELKGGTNASKLDLFKDETGNIDVKPKDGRGPGDPTGLNINNYKK